TGALPIFAAGGDHERIDAEGEQALPLGDRAVQAAPQERGDPPLAQRRAEDDDRGGLAMRREQLVGDRGAQEDQAAEAQIDRKSTRLNSSHVSISYAVFCLKKKKRNETPLKS